MIAAFRAALAGVGRPSFPSDIRDDPEHHDAVAFMKTMKPRDDTDYAWAAEYARSLWDARNKTFSILDEKADAIIKYLGGGTGVFALGVLAKVDAANWYVAISTLPAFLCALAAVVLASFVRKPVFAPGWPSVQCAVGYAENYESRPETKGKIPPAFLGQWHLACEDMALACTAKARNLEFATFCYCGALLLLLVPVIVAGFWPPGLPK